MSNSKESQCQEVFAERMEGLSPEKRMLLQKRLKQHVFSGKTVSSEPIAIIGMACRFPGGANDPEAFWKLLSEGHDAISELSESRWRGSILDKSSMESNEHAVLRWGGFVDAIDEFDAAFFDISPREAATMDPQQRMVMEVACEALESAGQPWPSFSGSDTGVFMGLHSQSSDYYWLQLKMPELLDTHAATGGAHSIVANRLSYFLDLRGPSMVVDTACSSSLVAVHMACQSLRNGECSMALAGGVNLILSPENSYAYSKLQFLSPDGRCKAFDAGANGYVRGEGCGVIVLRLLKDAIDAGDPVMAIIRGSAVNQDGATNGLTAPSGLSQQAVVQRALKNAGVEHNKITFVETHGTGTPLGDPIEVESLIAVLGRAKVDSQICYLGAVKTNIGHLEAAAGIAGIIKTVLCMQHQSIPANLHFNQLNPHISLQDTHIRIPVEMKQWNAREGERFAGVSSFGFGGTNSHVVLQEAPKIGVAKQSVAAAKIETCQSYLLPLSARSDETLAALVGRWQKYLADNETELQSLQEICYTASVRRTHHSKRYAVAGRRREELIERLKEYSNIKDARSTREGAHAKCSGTKGLVFVFSGQGAQWFGMGRQLLEQEPVFREMIERCSILLEKFANWSLLDELGADESNSRVNQTEIAQPALFALQMGLSTLWRSWGIKPDAVVGHSVGEVAAACFGGVLKLEDAIQVVYHRGRLLQRVTGLGRMAAVDISLEEAESIVANYHGRLTIAAINGPMSVTLSGESDALEHALSILNRQNVFCRMLPVNYAFHSPQIEPFRAEMIQSTEGIETRPAEIQIISTVTGKPAENMDFGSAYWAENIRQPVRFAEAIDGLILGEHTTFVEICPHPVLSLSISRCLSHRNAEGMIFPSLRRGKCDQSTLLETLGCLYTHGWDVNWVSLYPHKEQVVQLPPYPWNKKSYWIHPAEAPSDHLIKGVDMPARTADFIPAHRIRSRTLKNHVFEFCLKANSISFLEDHIVFDEIVLPAPVLVEMCFSAAYQAFGKEFNVLEDLRIHRGLLFSDDKEKNIEVIIRPETPNSAMFEIRSKNNNGDEFSSWEMLASGKIRGFMDIGRNKAASSSRIDKFKEILSKGEMAGAAIYTKLGEKGVQLGPLYQTIVSIRMLEREAVALICLPEKLRQEHGNYKIHPVLLDGALQLLMARMLVTNASVEMDAPYLFIGFDHFKQYAPAGPILYCHAVVEDHGVAEQEVICGDITLLNEKGACIADIKGACMKKVTRKYYAVSREKASETSIFEISWHPSPIQKDALVTANVMPSPNKIYEILSKGATSESRSVEHGQGKNLSDSLDMLCTAGIVRCCRQLGWQMTLGSIMNKDDLAFKLGVTDRHSRLFDRMIKMLVEDGILEPEGSTWKVKQDFQIYDQEEVLQNMVNKHPENEIELSLLGDCLHALPGVLRGEIEPMNLLFPGGSIERAEKLYQDSPVFKNYNELVRNIASIFISMIPEDRIVNVLEIGAGTGGTTAHILPEFTGKRSKYLFTDVSYFFLEKIKSKFSEHTFLSYKLLDIEKNPIEQGFPRGGFDLVIASNVLHATADLKQTLRNTLQLMAPNGLLVLIEGVHPARWVDMIFGLTPGWWLFSDSELRTNHPLISRESWLEMLKDLNFREPIVIGEGNSDEKEIFQQAVIMAQTPLAYQDRSVDSNNKEEEICSDTRKDHWLVFCKNSEIGRNIDESLNDRGIGCTLIYPEQVYDVCSDDRESAISPQINNFKSLISNLKEHCNSHFTNAVYLWGIDETKRCDTIEDIEKAVTFSCNNLACLVKAFINAENISPPRIWIVTQGAHALHNIEKPSVSQAPLWGMGRVLSAEHPDLWGGMIDLDPVSTANEAVQNMLVQILSDDVETQVSFRKNQRYIPSFSLLETFPEKSISFSKEKNYLITGGLGALGLKTARWMAEEGARKLVLVGRTVIPERSRWSEIKSTSPHYSKICEIRRIEALGAIVRTESVDVTSEEQMRLCFERLRKDGWGPIHGVVHTAGVIRDQLLHQLDVVSFRDVLRPKMVGAWLLNSLIGEDPLDFFILFSSVGSLLGQRGQTSYASANAFLDAVASYRKARNKTALSINWGPWAGAGLAVTAGGNATIQKLSAQGIESLSDAEATQAMGAMLMGKITQGAVLRVNWRKFKNAFPVASKSQSLASLARKLGIQSGAPSRLYLEDASNGIHNSLLAVEQGPQRRNLMEGRLAEILASILKQDRSLIHTEETFSTMGLDSLMALEFKSQCEKIFNLSLPAPIVWNYPTIKALSSYLSEKIGIPIDLDVQNGHLENVAREKTGFDLTAGKLQQGLAERIDLLSDEEALNALMRSK